MKGDGEAGGGPQGGGGCPEAWAALGAGWGSALFTALAAVCVIACVAALRLNRHLPPGANQNTAAHADLPAPPLAEEICVA